MDNVAVFAAVVVMDISVVDNVVVAAVVVYGYLYCGQGWAFVIFKRTFRSFHSFAFFIKERSVLSVLLHSL